MISQSATCQTICVLQEYETTQSANDMVLKLIFSNEEPFSAFGHIPIAVGINDFGDKEYLAECICMQFGTVIEGATHPMIQHVSWCTETRYTTHMLRHNPCDRMEVAVQRFNGSDATGPFFWKIV